MKIRIIGCGAMGSAIAQTLAEAKKELSLYDKHEERAESLARAIGITKCETPLEDLSVGDALLLAVKPQDFEAVAEELKTFEGGLITSIITGISASRLKQAFQHCTILRMMPNLAVRYGDGVVALAEDPLLIPYKGRIEEIFSPLGMLRWIPEKNFDAVTALTGSGPAFVFTLIEAMVEAAIEMGFSAEVGYDLVKQMVGGALTVLYESPDLPCELRWRVCSPSGTTIAGLRVLEKCGVRSALIETFVAACNRSKELGKNDL
jgi:pyrroline-5-carboxylate reductase